LILIGCHLVELKHFYLYVFQLGREVLDIAARAVAPGVTTAEIDRLVYEVSTAGSHKKQHFLQQ